MKHPSSSSAAVVKRSFITAAASKKKNPSLPLSPHSALPPPLKSAATSSVRLSVRPSVRALPCSYSFGLDRGDGDARHRRDGRTRGQRFPGVLKIGLQNLLEWPVGSLTAAAAVSPARSPAAAATSLISVVSLWERYVPAEASAEKATKTTTIAVVERGHGHG